MLQAGSDLATIGSITGSRRQDADSTVLTKNSIWAALHETSRSNLLQSLTVVITRRTARCLKQLETTVVRTTADTSTCSGVVILVEG
jgi:hypothetical protein